MAKEKKSFFERLTGTVRLDEKEADLDEEKSVRHLVTSKESWIEEEEKDAELTVDVSQNSDEIIVKAMVAGVHPDDLDVDVALRVQP